LVVLLRARHRRGAALLQGLRNAKFVAAKRATIRPTGSPRAGAVRPEQLAARLLQEVRRGARQRAVVRPEPAERLAFSPHLLPPS
jgi:hypothetical protein